MEVKLSFSDALKLDMERMELSEKTLGVAMGGISQQAIHKWIDRGFPPLYRLKDLIAVLGPDSAVSKLSNEDIYGAAPRLRTRIQNMADLPIMASKGSLGKGIVMRKGDAPRTSAEQRKHDAIMFAKEQRHQFLAALPSGLVRGAERPARVADFVFRTDYLSETLAVEMLCVHGNIASGNSAASLLTLLGVGKVRPDCRLLLLVVSDGEPRIPEITTATARLYGVEVRYVTNGAEAASVICELEGINPEAADFVEEPDA